MPNDRYLHQNKLSSLPNLSELSNLRYFHVYNNQLRNVDFPLSRTPSESCRGQGEYFGSNETNCFNNCPENCCNSTFLWPNCAPTSTAAPTPSPTTTSFSATTDISTSDNGKIETETKTSVDPAVSQSPSNSPPPTTNDNLPIIIGAAVGAVVVIALFITVLCFLKRGKDNVASKNDHELSAASAAAAAKPVSEAAIGHSDHYQSIQVQGARGVQGADYVSITPAARESKDGYTDLPSARTSSKQYGQRPVGKTGDHYEAIDDIA